MTRHFLDLWQLSAADLRAILDEARRRKAMRAGFTKGRVDADRPAAGHTLAMIFEKNSTRTRFSFDAAMRQLSGYFGQQLQGLKDRYPDVIAEIRGKGLLIGLKLIPNNREFMQLARDQRLLIAGGGENCVRLLPALIMTVDEAREVIERLEAACKAAQDKAAEA